MPVPELKTGEIDWNDPNMVEKRKMSFITN